MNGATEVTDSFALILADYTVTEVGNEGFADTLFSKVKDELKLSKFITYNANDPLGILYSETEFNTLSLNDILVDDNALDDGGTCLSDRMKSIKVGQIESMGIISLDAYEARLNTAFGGDSWKNMKFSEFFGAILAMAFPTP